MTDTQADLTKDLRFAIQLTEAEGYPECAAGLRVALDRLAQPADTEPRADGIIALAVNDATPHVADGTMLLHWRVQRALEIRIAAALQSEREAAADAPIPMALFCPACGLQHVDKTNWDSPPHRTHQCQGCGHLWRPAAVYTEGVADVPLGTSDTRPAIRTQTAAAAEARRAALEDAARLVDHHPFADDAEAGCMDAQGCCEMMASQIRGLASPSPQEETR